MAIYYVDGDNGNDGWDGLAETYQGGTNGPKATVGSITPGTGDEIRIIKATSAYDEGGFQLSAIGATQESDRVTFRGWVVGQAATDPVAPANRPVLAALTGGGGDIVDLNNNDYISLEDLALDGAQSGYDCIDGNTASYLRVRRCLLANAAKAWQCTTGPTYDVLIEDTEIDTMAEDGINSSTNLQGITIRRCYIHDILDGGTSGDGIQLQHQVAPPLLSNVLIEDCYFENVEKDLINIGGCRTGTLIIRRNYLDCQGQTVDPSEAMFIAGCKAATIEDNSILDPTGNGINYTTANYDATPYLPGQATIQRNTIALAGGTANYKRGIYVNGHDGNDGEIHIYNNTVHAAAEGALGGGEGIMYRVDSGDAVGDPTARIKNNTSFDNDDNGLEIRGTYVGGTVTVDNDNNCYNGNGAADIDDSNGWGNNPEPNGLTQDPLVRDKAGFNFRLRQDSPCIGAGAAAVASQHGGPPDIGAWEYGAPLFLPDGRPARMRGGKYYRGQTPADFALEGMER